MTLRTSILPIASAITLSACAMGDTEHTDDGKTSSLSQAIINGTPLNSGSWPASNMVELPNADCSGVALDSEWTLTADHCADWLTADSSIASIGRQSPSNQVENRIVSEIFSHPTQDIALLRVHPFRSPNVDNYLLWNASLSTLSSRELYCVGRGRRVLWDDDDRTWRGASFPPPSSIETNGYRLVPNAAGQIMWKGDSGGPCLYSFDFLGSKVTYITGIHSNATLNPHLTAVESAYDVGLTPATSSWIDDIRHRSQMVFYRETDGVSWISSLERNGTYQAIGYVNGLPAQRDKVAALRNGAILLYNSTTGDALAAQIKKNGSFAIKTTFSLDAGITHIAPVGVDGIFMYNSTSGVGKTGRLSASGVYTEGETIPGFKKGWTHVVGTRRGGLFFYKQDEGVASTATINTNLHYSMANYLTGFSTGWTDIVSVGEDGILFYNSTSGSGWTARVAPSGAYQTYGSVNGIGSGYKVTGATNGTVLFRDAVGGGKLAKVAPNGSYSPLASLSNFSTKWTHVLAE